MINGASSGTIDIPVRASYPRQLIIHDSVSGEWRPIDDSTEVNRTLLITSRYLAVSYRQSDFPNKEELEKTVQSVCETRHLTAYWFDFACTGETQDAKNQDLYRIADVFRFATETLIMIPDPPAVGWKSWGDRVWTYPEALLSEKHICKVGTRYVKEIRLIEIHNLAYTGNEIEHRLSTLYATGGKDFLRFKERFRDLCFAIWTRKSGPGESPSMTLSSQFTALPAECVYALMGFLQERIIPDPNESIEQAFDRLMEINGLVCNIYPWIAVETEETFEVENATADDVVEKAKYSARTRTRKVKNGDTIVRLPHVAAAEYNSSQCAVKKTCAEGTRVTVLASIYKWFERDHNVKQESERRVFWLYGVAGSGKSTIANTVAEYCDKRDILGATFFCSCYNRECSNVLDIFPTISYQLCQRDDSFKNVVLEALAKDKDLSRTNISTQLEKLIIGPLRAMKRDAQFAVIIDALDECSNDSSVSDLLQVLLKYITDLAPIKFFITSRPESRIRVDFLTLDLSRILSEENNSDIRSYLHNELPLISSSSGQTWPKEDDIDEIVEKSGGLFIFASTVVKFLTDRRNLDPVGQLAPILNPPAPSSSSFNSRLDQLYLRFLEIIFSNADDYIFGQVRMAFSILIAAKGHLSINTLEELMPGTNVYAILQPLRALIVVTERTEREAYVSFMHPSFKEFLMDGQRCSTRFAVERPNNVITQCCARQLLLFVEKADPREVVNDYMLFQRSEMVESIAKSVPDDLLASIPSNRIRSSLINLLYSRGIWKGNLDGLQYAFNHISEHLDLYGRENFEEIKDSGWYAVVDSLSVERRTIRFEFIYDLNFRGQLPSPPKLRKKPVVAFKSFSRTEAFGMASILQVEENPSVQQPSLLRLYRRVVGSVTSK